MITINLLPESERTPETASVQQLYRSPLLVMVVGALAAILVVLGVIVQARHGELTRVQAALDALKAKRQEVDGVKAALQALREQHAAYAGLGSQRSRWSKQLALLPQMAPDGVWFTELSFDGKKGLVLQGAAITQGGDEMLRIGRLAQALKADPVFSELVRDVQIESMKRIQDGDIEVIHFTLTGSVSG